ncbi:MAG: hypothetical protein ACYDDF_01755 [Thermoplasmatota archaeon]
MATIDLAGHAAVILLCVGWVAQVLGAPPAAQVLLVAAAVAAAIPIARGMRFRRSASALAQEDVPKASPRAP